MKGIHIITPVKDSIELTLQTIRAVSGSLFTVPHTYTVYNDFSSPENTRLLTDAAAEYGFTLVNLADHTDTPSPNYLLILRHARRQALDADAALCVVESDVVVSPETIQQLFDRAVLHPDCGMMAAVTTDSDGTINYPYLHSKAQKNRFFATRKRLSFCCTLLSLRYLQTFDFKWLDPKKVWYDVAISHQSLKHGFKNYLCTDLPTFHRPHGSRPWKRLKYTHPLKYYWLKLLYKRDRI